MSASRPTHHRHFAIATALCLALPVSAFAAAGQQADLVECGAHIEPPAMDIKPQRRLCPPATARAYHPRHQGIGFEILELESQACFVPDTSYALLDRLIDETLARLTKSERSGVGISARDRVLAVSEALNATLLDNDFIIAIPIAALGDALVSRPELGSDIHLIDCDMASFILMTVADVMGIPSNLVEMTLDEGAGHNFVRWSLGNGQFVDWDANARSECQMPLGQPAFQGTAMSRAEVIAYIRFLRPPVWKSQKNIGRAMEDYRFAMQFRPNSPAAYNGFAWTVASLDWPGRAALYPEALAAIDRAINIQIASGDPAIMRRYLADYKDTLACLHAYRRNFQKAAAVEKEAINITNNLKAMLDFEEHLARFTAPNPRDCTGD